MKDDFFSTFTFMQIGFEAKRIFQNTTGLGNYARNLIDGLCTYAPNHQYHLFAPKQTSLFPIEKYSQVSLHLPKGFIHQHNKAYWRSRGVSNEIKKMSLDVYHGLSFELPRGLEKIAIAKMVSVHDLIFERFPEQYNPIDVWISRNKTKHACIIADCIATMSIQTKQDLVDIYHISPDKITITYPCCDASFLQKQPADILQQIKIKYHLPDQFFLSVGSIIERKGLMKICEAMHILQAPIPLVVIGKGNNAYAKKVRAYIHEKKMTDKIIFLNEHPAASSHDFTSSKDFPAIYQLAFALIYPSLFEGFGIPVLEGISSGIPVISSRTSSMPEAGGKGALYINPSDEHEIAHAMSQLLNDSALNLQLIRHGQQHAQEFTKEKMARQMIDLYTSFV